jgi:hypothetical protein
MLRTREKGKCLLIKDERHTADGDALSATLDLRSLGVHPFPVLKRNVLEIRMQYQFNCNQGRSLNGGKIKGPFK